MPRKRKAETPEESEASGEVDMSENSKQSEQSEQSDQSEGAEQPQASEESEVDLAELPPAVQAATPMLERLERAFTECNRPFSCSGAIPLTDALETARLFYSTKGEGDPKDSADATSVPLLLSESQIKALYDAGAPSPFGRGDQLTYDESYRSAREIKYPHFALSDDVLAAGRVLEDLQRRLVTKPLRASVTKLNAYATGGFFKAHRDTPHGNTHIGTITLCLPSTATFSGGELVVRHRDESVTYDWGATNTENQLSWAFLYSDCEHEVLPVTSGTRVTVAYDVFVQEDKEPLRPVPADSSHEIMAKLLRDMIEDLEFYPQGRTLAFGLQHEYACDTFTRADMNKLLGQQLKGADAVWLDVIAKSGLKWEFKAVYEDEYSFHDADEYAQEHCCDKLTGKAKKAFEADMAAIEKAFKAKWPKEPSWNGDEPTWQLWYDDQKAMRQEQAATRDKHSGLVPRGNGYKGRHMYAANTFYLFNEADCGDGVSLVDLAKAVGEIDQLDPDWVVKTAAFGGRNEWVSHGNEPQAEVNYVGAAIFVTLPPYPERVQMPKPEDDGPSPPKKGKKGKGKK